MTDNMARQLGEPFTIKWRVHGHVNSAEIAYYHIEIDVFLLKYDGEDCARILATQKWLDANEWADPMNRIRRGESTFGAESAEYVRAYVEGTRVDPLDVYAHPRIDPVDRPLRT